LVREEGMSRGGGASSSEVKRVFTTGEIKGVRAEKTVSRGGMGEMCGFYVIERGKAWKVGRRTLVVLSTVPRIVALVYSRGGLRERLKLEATEERAPNMC
jgi:hypothetical protein